MVKRAKVKSGDMGDSALAKKLEAGEPVEGLGGYVLMEAGKDGDDIAVKVRCKGLKVNGSCVSVIAEPVSGSGTFIIDPSQWLDSDKQIKERKDQLERLEAAQSDFKRIAKKYYRHERREALDKYVKDGMTKEEQEAFYNALKEHLGMESVPETIPYKLTKDTLRDFATIAVCVVHGLPPGEYSAHSFDSCGDF